MVSFSTTEQRLEKIDQLLGKERYPDRSTFINTAIDFYLRHLETKFLSDLMYYIGFPVIAFLICIGLTFYLTSILFYIITTILGIYLIVLGYLFYTKYRGRKWQKE